MRTPLLLAALLVAAVALGAAPVSAPAARSCAVTGSETVRDTPFARIYYTRQGRPYSCYRLTGRRVALDTQVDRFYAFKDAHLGLVRISRRILGYTWIDPGIPAVYVHSLDMRTGRLKHRTKIEPLIVIDPSAVAVPQIVVTATGSVAWIQRLEGYYSVWRMDRHGRRRIGGPDTTRPTSSLLLRGTRLTWRQAGRLRTSRLVEPAQDLHRLGAQLRVERLPVRLRELARAVVELGVADLAVLGLAARPRAPPARCPRAPTPSESRRSGAETTSTTAASSAITSRNCSDVHRVAPLYARPSSRATRAA